MSEFAVKDTEAHKRLVSLFDDGAFTEIEAFAKSAEGDVEVVAGFGMVNGAPVYAFSQDINNNSGAVSVAQCEKINKIYGLAKKTGCPVVAVYDSNGVKLTEGFEVLSAYGEILKNSSSLSGVVPQIAIIAGACLGTSALVANMADVVIAVKDADFYVSAPSELTADESAEAGVIDILADDFDAAVNSARELVALLPSNNLAVAPVFDFTDPLPASSSAEVIDIINSAADAGSVIELKKNYAKNCVTAFGSVIGSTVGFIGFNGSALCPSCCYKAEAFVKLCDAFNIPIVTFVDSKGLSGEKETQLLVAATKLVSAYAGATCPKISVITGNAIGAAYIVLAGRGSNADLVYSWDCAVASPLEVDAAVAFLYNERLAAGESRSELEKEYKDHMASPFTAAACGAIDNIFTPEETRSNIIAALDILAGKRENTIPRKHSVK